MKIFLSLVILLSIGGCANREDKTVQPTTANATAEKSEVAFGGHCAMGLCLKKKVKGDPKYSVDYKGKTYLFSSEEAKQNFLKDVDGNIAKANKQFTALGADRVN